MLATGAAVIFRRMPAHDPRYRRWLDDEREAKRLDRQRSAARRRCDAELTSAEREGAKRVPALVKELGRLERSIETSLAFYLGHVANDADFLAHAFGAERARAIASRLERRKLALLTELDRVSEMRLKVKKRTPGRTGPGSP